MYRWWAAIYVAVALALALAVLGGVFVLAIIALVLYVGDVVLRAW